MERFGVLLRILMTMIMMMLITRKTTATLTGVIMLFLLLLGLIWKFLYVIFGVGNSDNRL